MGYRAVLNDNTVFYDNELAEYDAYKLTTGVINQTISTAGSFIFTIPFSNAIYDSVKVLTDYVKVYRDSTLVFWGRVYGITEQLLGHEKTVTCEGMLAVLNDSVVRPLEYRGTLRGMVSAILAEHNGQVSDERKISIGTITVQNRKCSRKYTAYETSMSRLDDLRGYYGGFFAIRESNGTMYLDWKESYDVNSSQMIRLGENLLEIAISVVAKDIATRVVPLGTYTSDGTRTTIKPINNDLDYVQAPSDMVSKYGIITKSISYQNVEDPEELYRNAWDYIYSQSESVSSYTVRAYDLYDAGYDVDMFEIGQRIRLDVNPLAYYGDEYDKDVAVVGIAIAGVATVGKGGYSQWLNVNSTTKDIVNPANGFLEIGTTINSYSQSLMDENRKENRNYETVSQDKASVDAMTQAINTVNNRIDQITTQLK